MRSRSLQGRLVSEVALLIRVALIAAFALQLQSEPVSAPSLAPAAREVSHDSEPATLAIALLALVGSLAGLRKLD